MAFSLTAEDSNIGMNESCSGYSVTGDWGLSDACGFMYSKSIGTDADNIASATYGAQVITIGWI